MKKTRFIALLLSLAMLMSLVPVTAAGQVQLSDINALREIAHDWHHRDIDCDENHNHGLDEPGLGLSLSQSAGNCAHVYETRWFLFTEYENPSVNTSSTPWVDNQTYARFCTLCHEPQLSKAPYAGQ